jgi:hypothetical protein
VLAAARYASAQWSLYGGRSVHQTVCGYGTLGRATVAVLLDWGCPPGNITVVERSPARRAEVPKGVHVCSPEEHAQQPPPELGVGYLATDGQAVDASNLRPYGTFSFLFPYTSGGGAIDWESLAQAGAHIRDVRWHGDLFSSCATERSESGFPFQDREIFFGGDDLGRGEVGVFVPCEGFPIDLVCDGWWDRMVVSPVGLALAVTTAASLDAPGEYSVDPELDAYAVEHFARRGMTKPRWLPWIPFSRHSWAAREKGLTWFRETDY